VTLCESNPDVPLSVSVRVPVVAFLPTVTVTVACAELVPFSVTGLGETLHVVLAGAPLHESETFPAKPLSGVKVSVYVPE
jgi:hypothetical protein